MAPGRALTKGLSQDTMTGLYTMMRVNLRRASRRALIAVCGSLLLGACSESSPTPLAPSSLPTEKVELFSLTCAPSVSRQSFEGETVAVQYGAPTTYGGLEPVTTECLPESGTPFSVGTTTVTCTGRDGLQQAASCTLSVRIIPTISVSRILAFGDSLTAGVTSDVIPTSVEIRPSKSYPAQLGELLSQRYSGQSIRMTNSGIPGEKAVNAVSRFKRELARVQPDVVLIMEGTNDLDPDTLSPGVQAAAAVETMVQHAKTRGVDPILATIPPQRTARSTEPAVVPYNELIRQVAVRQGVPLVDVYQIINTGLCIGAGSLSLSCLGDDHMHPTIEGYSLIAAGFLQRFIQIYEPGGVGLGFQPRTLSDRLLPPVGRIGWRKFE